jgi:hypothetical protein
MARENQGLQIALIVFVMLTIILGVLTFIFFRKFQESDIKATANAQKAAEATKLATQNETDVTTLKKLIGVAPTDKVDAIATTTFNDDMRKYAGSYPEDVRFYRPLLEKMSNTIDEKNKELDLTKAKVAKLEADFAVREESKQPQIDDFKKAAEAASKDLAGERDKFQADRDSLTQDQAKLKADLETARKEAAASLAEIDKKIQGLTAQVAKDKVINKALTDEKQQLVSTKFEVPSGEIRWINQRSGTAWINLGSGDGLQRQFTFGVYPSDTTDIATGKKGSIEVTKILGDHLAEVRVFDDKLLDPIMPGDKIYTPVWIPGDKRHFALAGFSEGNGSNGVQYIKNLIDMNGGTVDCYLDEKGKRVGDMSIKTRFLVIGQPPSDKGSSEVINAYTKMQEDAERLGAQKIQVGELLHRMGWKNTSPIHHYGSSSGSDETASSGESATPKTTTPEKDIFKHRAPPARVPISSF